MALAVSLGLFAGSLSAIALMFVQKWTEFHDLPPEEEPSWLFDTSFGFVGRDTLESIRQSVSDSRFWQSAVMLAVEKTLRRSRLWFLKAEHRVGSLIEGLRRRKENGNGAGASLQHSLPPTSVGESSYLPMGAQERERALIERIAHNPKGVTNYKELGFLYLNNGFREYARETFAMAVKLGSKDRQLQKALEKLGGTVTDGN